LVEFASLTDAWEALLENLLYECEFFQWQNNANWIAHCICDKLTSENGYSHFAPRKSLLGVCRYYTLLPDKVQVAEWRTPRPRYAVLIGPPGTAKSSLVRGLAAGLF